jgi:hypothetical protein
VTSEKHKLGRRLFLGGAALTGASLGMPWLSSLGGGTARAGVMPPRRFVLVSLGHSMQSGSEPDWMPEAAGPLVLSPMLAPLAEFRDRITTVRGIDNLVTRLVSSNGHDSSSRTLLSCQPHGDALNPDGSIMAGAPMDEWFRPGGGPSIDYVMADAFDQAPLTLRVGGENGEHRRTFRFDRSDDQGEPNPSVAFERLFASVGPTPPPEMLTPRERLLRRRDAILGTVRENYRALSTRVSALDRVRLEQHAALIESFVADLTRTIEIVCEDPRLDLDPDLGSAFEDGDGRNDDAIARTQNNLIATSLACDAVRVVSLHYSNMQTNKFPWLNGGADMFGGANWHGVTHREGGTDEERFRVMEWYSEIFADLLRKLAAVPEGEGTLLDNTVVVLTTSLGDSSHGTDRLPFVIASPPGGPFVTGQHVDLGSRRTLGDMWTTMLNGMGIAASSFGYDIGEHDDRPFNSGAIEELMA